MKSVPIALFALLLAMYSPPAGRPPIGPLERIEPKLYDFTYNVTVSTAVQPEIANRQYFDLADAPIVMPLVFLGTFSRIESDSVNMKLWLNGGEDKAANSRVQIKADLPQHTNLATLTIPKFDGMSIRWQISYRTQAWSSRINDADAVQLSWPQSWPDEVKDGLKPEKYIEIDDDFIKETLQKFTNGRVKQVAPYLAAKELIRSCIGAIRISGDGTDSGEFGVNRGMEVQGAYQALHSGIGSPHDLVCACVAMLRAANIPARPVIGCEENSMKEDREELVSWLEFYLEGAGWIPCDPEVLRGKGVRNLDVHKPWPEFGTMKNLNERITLAYHFIPPISVQSPRNPAVWGWNPRPGGDPGSEQNIKMGITSRGKGVEDPK
jgi:hypothetical protein